MALATVLGNCPPLPLLSQASRIDSELPSQPPLGPDAVPIASMHEDKSSSLIIQWGDKGDKNEAAFQLKAQAPKKETWTEPVMETPGFAPKIFW